MSLLGNELDGEDPHSIWCRSSVATAILDWAKHLGFRHMTPGLDNQAFPSLLGKSTILKEDSWIETEGPASTLKYFSNHPAFYTFIPLGQIYLED